MAKPVVDRLETELEGRAEVMRLNLMTQTGQMLAGRYGLRGVPTLYVFDGEGNVVYSQGGIPDRAAVVSAVEQVLSQ